MTEGRWDRAVSGVGDGGVPRIGLAMWLRKEVEVLEGKSKKVSQVMKCNENDNLPYCGECLPVNSG